MACLLLNLLTIFVSLFFAAAGLSASDSPAIDAYESGDIDLAVELWESGCAADDSEACFHLGVVYRDGETGTRDVAKSAELFEKSCSLNYGPACYNLSWMASRSGDETSQKDEFAFLQRGCDADYAPACANLGYSLARGIGIDQDTERGIALLETACAGKAGRACFILSALFDVHEGDPIREDPARANAALERGCDLGDSDSCLNLGYHYREGYGVDRDMVRARSLYAAACDDANFLACPMLAPNEFFGGGSHYGAKDVAESKRKAAGLYKDGCDAGLAQGCYSLAMLIAKSGQSARNPQRMESLISRTLSLNPQHPYAARLGEKARSGELPDDPVF
ncbi:MAG: tetratricopeptide repeat protein [Pontixanthobacter sp.]